MYCGEEKRKAKGKASRKKGEEGRRKGKGEDKGEIALQIINNTKKQSYLFPKLHFLPMQSCCIQLAKQKGKPGLEDTAVSILQRLPLGRPPDLPAVVQPCQTHLSPYASPWLHTGTRITCMQPCIRLFPKSPEIILAAQNINTSLRTTLLNTDVALARALLPRGVSPSFAWVPVPYKEISVVLH